MEGGDLRALSQRAWLRPWSLVVVAAALVVSLLWAPALVASAATSHAPVRAPHLVGLTRARVYAVTHADGLYFQTRGPGSSTGTWVSVVAQSPAPGTLVAWHSQMTLTTSLNSPTGPRAVPRLVGRSRAQVYAEMRRAQLYFRTVGPGSASGRWVVVLHQFPAPGKRVAWHSQVVLSVSTHRALAVHHVATTTTTTKPKTTRTDKPKPVAHPTTTTSTTLAPVTSSTYPGEVATSSTTSTTTTLHAPTTTTTRKKVVASRSRVGVATWYNYFPGRCATWFVPMGTRLTITVVATGQTIHCRVTDREQARGNRVVDLSETQFTQLAPLARGVVLVKVSW